MSRIQGLETGETKKALSKRDWHGHKRLLFLLDLHTFFVLKIVDPLNNRGRFVTAYFRSCRNKKGFFTSFTIFLGQIKTFNYINRISIIETDLLRFENYKILIRDLQSMLTSLFILVSLFPFTL